MRSSAHVATLVLHSHVWLTTFTHTQMVSRELERECIVVFDEAHNIDNVCIEALSVNLRSQTLDAASRNIGRLNAVSTAYCHPA